MGKKSAKSGEGLAWYSLSLIGLGCIIGTGFFLGSSIGIQMAGPSVLFAFLIAGIGTFIVYDSLGRMSAQDPQKGSFRSYAKKAFGPWAGFTTGWVYWMSEMLITGSQLTALSIFTKFWFPNVPLWVFSAIYAALGVIVVLLGSKGFEKVENLLGVVKLSAILMFIIIAVLGLMGIVDGQKGFADFPNTKAEILPNGLKGLWSSLIFGFYAFGGIEIMGIMATRLKNKEDAPKAGKVMLVTLTTIYLISIFLAVTMIGWKEHTDKKSPFVSALHEYDHLNFVPHVFNGALIIAGFSTMAASLFAITTMLVTMANDHDAPKILTKTVNKLKVPPIALAVTIAGLIASIITALLLPDTIYEYITTAAGLMLLYNWIMVLFSAPRLITFTKFDHAKRYIGIVLITSAISGTLLHDSSRPGLFVSLVIVLLITCAAVISHFVKDKSKRKQRFSHVGKIKSHRHGHRKP